MTDFLLSIKADLLDRRIVPLLALVAVGLVAAAAYAVLGGGSTSAAPSAAAVTPATPVATPGIVVSQPTTSKAVAETTSGASTQRRGIARNPFAPLPGAAKAASTASASSQAAPTTPASSPSSGSSAASAPVSPSPASSAPTPAAPSKPSPAAPPKTVYHTAVLFGVVPAEAPAEGVQLTPYENLKLLTPLPSAKQPLVVYRGVNAGGKTATFTLVGEVILHGSAACLPSASQCQAIQLEPGQSEQLEYLSASGEAVISELRLVSITSVTASSASLRSVLRGESKAGRELLRGEGLTELPDMSYSTETGVLELAGHPAFAARAHAAASSRHKR